jgi:hypothetical protein
MRFLPRPTYSNVVATLALFIALGGISYAATQLPNNSVGTRQIKNKAVTKAKINPALLKQLKGRKAQPMKVRARNGRVLGTFAGLTNEGLPLFQVLIKGGLYTFYPSGQLISLTNNSPVFKTDTCTGTPYIESALYYYNQVFSKLAGGPTRVVFRTSPGGGLGPARAWKITTAHERVVGANIWELNETTGACEPAGTSTGELVRLKSVPAPKDAVGPLTVR